MTLQAGPELDRLVAERVMGWTAEEIGGSLTGFTNGRIISASRSEHRADGRVITFHPSENIAHAWEVVEHLRKNRFLALELTPKTEPVGWWTASWIDVGDANEDDYEMVHDVYVHAPTAPHAICLAALKAVAATS